MIFQDPTKPNLQCPSGLKELPTVKHLYVLLEARSFTTKPLQRRVNIRGSKYLNASVGPNVFLMRH